MIPTKKTILSSALFIYLTIIKVHVYSFTYLKSLYLWKREKITQRGIVFQRNQLSSTHITECTNNLIWLGKKKLDTRITLNFVVFTSSNNFSKFTLTETLIRHNKSPLLSLKRNKESSVVLMCTWSESCRK